MSEIKSKDYWKDANALLNSMLPENPDKIIGKYIQDQNFTDEEARLFMYYLKDAFGFQCTITLLKLPSTCPK